MDRNDIARIKETIASRHALRDVGAFTTHLSSYHTLRVHVEHCRAKRPSATLKGKAERYEELQQRIAGLVEDSVFRGNCALELPVNVPEHRYVEPAPGEVPRKTASPWRDATQKLTPNEKAAAVFPRIGSFEVSIVLRDNRSGTTFGPELISSKLNTQKFPNPDLVLARIERKLGEYVGDDAEDDGPGVLRAPLDEPTLDEPPPPLPPMPPPAAAASFDEAAPPPDASSVPALPAASTEPPTASMEPSEVRMNDGRSDMPSNPLNADELFPPVVLPNGDISDFYTER